MSKENTRESAEGTGEEGRQESTARWTLVVVLAMSSSLVRAQTPTCAAPGCNPVTSGTNYNTAMGTDALGANSTFGCCNTAAGYRALSVATSDHNTAFGESALGSDTSGFFNTALGSRALYSNTTGDSNTASGLDALYSNTSGAMNTALGFGALYSNTTGNYNTSSGLDALFSNTTGANNTASGYAALSYSTTGANNTASGYEALFRNTSGANNTASGSAALYSNTTGKGNAAHGVNALYSNTTGIRNLAIGNNALYDNVDGSYNIALGFDAGYNVTTGSNNIEIGSSGTANDNGTIQIGVQGTQTQTTIAGIYGTPITGSAVYVTATGQLGVLGSSERFKTDIAPMPELSNGLSQLRPVTFHYKDDPKRIQQYGLIAEEVVKVYPQLVIRDEAGRIQGVRYEELAPMLLNEMQQQHEKMSQQIDLQAMKIESLEKQLAAIQAALVRLQPKDQLVALR